jgi:hypothetical protein
MINSITKTRKSEEAVKLVGWEARKLECLEEGRHEGWEARKLEGLKAIRLESYKGGRKKNCKYPGP